MADLPLQGKVVVVTGGAGLLGRTFCSAVLAQGGIAIVADRDIGAAAAVAAGLDERTGGTAGRAEAAELDITDTASVSALVARLSAQFGRIDGLVNNAYPRNARYGRALEAVTYEDFCDNVGMHLGGYFLVSQQFAAAFARQGYGSIVNMASVYGVIAPRFEVYQGTPMTMPVEYAAIKSGVIHMSKYFAQYYKAAGVRVNALSPGGILDRQPASFVGAYNALAGAKGMLDPADIAGTLTFLLSDAARHVTGQNIVVDDGFSL